MTKGKVEMTKSRRGRKGEMTKSRTRKRGEVAKGGEEREWDMPAVVCDGAPGRVYDLAGRTQRFGIAVVAYARRVPLTPVTRALISQVVRAGTSVGANYCEADGAESRKDFRHRIAICRREARETCYWLEMLATALPGGQRGSTELLQEAKELNLIFSASMRTLSDPDR